MTPGRCMLTVNHYHKPLWGRNMSQHKFEQWFQHLTHKVRTAETQDSTTETSAKQVLLISQVNKDNTEIQLDCNTGFIHLWTQFYSARTTDMISLWYLCFNHWTCDFTTWQLLPHYGRLMSARLFFSIQKPFILNSCRARSSNHTCFVAPKKNWHLHLAPFRGIPMQVLDFPRAHF